MADDSGLTRLEPAKPDRDAGPTRRFGADH